MSNDTTKPEFDLQYHPWFEMVTVDDDSIDEVVRFSLDEIWIA